MTTPVRLHQLRSRAAMHAAATPQGAPAQGSAYELMLAQLYEHRRRLHDIKSVERKIEAKATFLASYEPWIDGVLAQGQGSQDLIITTMLVWHIDVGNYERALQIARYAVHYQLAMPDQYERDLATVLIDEFSTAALAGKLASYKAIGDPGDPGAPEGTAIDLLSEVLTLTQGADAHDQARAKLHKACAYALIGKSAIQEVDFKTLTLEQCQLAMPHLTRAFELFEGVGVKKDIERLERRLKDLQPPDPS